MRKKQLAIYPTQQLVKHNPNYHLTPQAVQGLANILILMIGLLIAMLLSVSHIYLLMLIQSD